MLENWILKSFGFQNRGLCKDIPRVHDWWKEIVFYINKRFGFRILKIIYFETKILTWQKVAPRSAKPWA